MVCFASQLERYINDLFKKFNIYFQNTNCTLKSYQLYDSFYKYVFQKPVFKELISLTSLFRAKNMSTIEQNQIFADDQIQSILFNMICQICHNLPVEIFRCDTSISPCNNTYCKPCAEKIMNNSQAEERCCFTCQKPGFKIAPFDICRQVRMVLNDVCIFCCNRPLGCQFQTLYKTSDQLFYHQTQLCSFRPETVTVCRIDECEFSAALATLNSHNCLVETKKVLREEILHKKREFEEKIIMEQIKYENEYADLSKKFLKAKKVKKEKF